MKKWLRMALCAALMVTAMTVSAFADETLIAPNPNAAPQGDFLVLVNGELVTFTDAVPKIKNDRSCLPFVAVFEQLGFAEKDMTWDGDTKTVTATKGDTTISLTIGKNEIVLTKAGQTEVIPTDVAPYIEPALSRTYIPFGLVADALDYAVGWDADDKAVIIDDVDAIFAANDATYELMEKYMDYNYSFAQKNQNVNGGYTMYMGIVDPTSNMEFLLNGEYAMTMANSTAIQFDTDMVVDASMVVDGEDLLAGTDSGLPMAIDMELRGDLNTGLFYFQSAALADSMGQSDMASAWYKLDMASLFDELGSVLGMDYAGLMALSTQAADMEFEEYLAAIIKAMPLTDMNMTTSDSLAMYNLLFADASFTRSGSKYVNEIPLAELAGIEEALDATMNFTIFTNSSGSKVNGYSMTMDIAEESAGVSMSMDVSMEEDEMLADISMGIGMEDSMIQLSMSIGGTYQPTSAAPATEPPAGAVIIDLMAAVEEAVPAA